MTTVRMADIDHMTVVECGDEQILVRFGLLPP